MREKLKREIAPLLSKNKHLNMAANANKVQNQPVQGVADRSANTNSLTVADNSPSEAPATSNNNNDGFSSNAVQVQQ